MKSPTRLGPPYGWISSLGIPSSPFLAMAANLGDASWGLIHSTRADTIARGVATHEIYEDIYGAFDRKRKMQ